MSVKKILIDQNAPASIYEEFRNLNYRVEFSRDLLPHKEKAEDREILCWAATHNWYVVTEDKDFLGKDKDDSGKQEYPCNDPKLAHRTVLSLPKYQMYKAAKYIVKAWQTIGWERVRASPLIEIKEGVAVIYKCDEAFYVEAQRIKIVLA